MEMKAVPSITLPILTSSIWSIVGVGFSYKLLTKGRERLPEYVSSMLKTLLNSPHLPHLYRADSSWDSICFGDLTISDLID